jgi:L-asparaginase
LETIEKSKFKRFIITHGTYTMPDTARYLKANLKRKDATVILTGAMIPMYNMTNSDGPFNLGFSIASFDHLKKGIYVCMNGRIFEPEEVLKTLYNGRFSSIFGEK